MKSVLEMLSVIDPRNYMFLILVAIGLIVEASLIVIARQNALQIATWHAETVRRMYIVGLILAVYFALLTRFHVGRYAVPYATLISLAALVILWVFAAPALYELTWFGWQVAIATPALDPLRIAALLDLNLILATVCLGRYAWRNSTILWIPRQGDGNPEDTKPAPRGKMEYSR